MVKSSQSISCIIHSHTSHKSPISSPTCHSSKLYNMHWGLILSIVHMGNEMQVKMITKYIDSFQMAISMIIKKHRVIGFKTRLQVWNRTLDVVNPTVNYHPGPRLLKNLGPGLFSKSCSKPDRIFSHATQVLKKTSCSVSSKRYLVYCYFY